MALKAFGKINYGDNDRSTGARYSNLEYIKKSLSFYMPNKGPQWCNGQGNPTKSGLVNGLLRLVQKLEARGQGSKSQRKRALTEDEMVKEVEMMRAQPDWTHQVKYPCMAMWQFGLIGRIDDTCHHRIRDPKGHKRFEFALQTKVRWSKNVVDERKCPDQIILGAGDPLWCLQLHLSVYLESMLQQHPNTEYLFTEHTGKKAPDNLKDTWRARLAKVVWQTDEFAVIMVVDEDEDDAGVGTHSRRKFAADFAANCGCLEMEIEIRARWKQQRSGRMVPLLRRLEKVVRGREGGGLPLHRRAHQIRARAE